MSRAVRLLPRLLVVVVAVLACAGPALGSDPGGVWPLSPRPTVVQGFDPPSSPYGAGHRGLDLLGTVAQPVYAALAGRVTFAGQLAGRGVVVVDHGASRTTYEPVSATVKVGASVLAGQQIGVLTSTLSHCFPSACLHLGWIRNADDVYLDPAGLFGVSPVRLLPLDGSVVTVSGASLPGPLVEVARLVALLW